MAEHSVTAAEQEYLESLFWLYEAGLPMSGANLARAMRLSAPTVHEMLGRLERDGYIERTDGRKVQFTESGREQAQVIVGRHRMIERFLTDVVGVPWDDVHEEAEKLEYAMTPRFEAYIRSAVGDASTCPHGHPIKVGERIVGVPLADCEVGANVTILRLENEAEDLLHYLKGAGIEPGLQGTVAANDGDEVQVNSDGETASLTFSVAETVSVLADPSPPPRIALPEQLVSAGATAAETGPRSDLSGQPRHARRQPAVDLRVDRRMVEQIEVRGAADVGVLVDRELQPLAAPAL